MSVRTARLFGGTSGPTGTHTLYTCPAGITTIVKDVRLSQNSAGNLQTILGTDSGQGLLYIINVTTTGNGQTAQAQGFIVLAPGDRIWVNCSVADGAQLHISGTRLQGVAP